MFEYVRTHQRLMQFILLLFIVPSFALVGISSYLRGDPAEVALAKVAGQNITQQEFDDALRDQMDRMRQRFGAQFDETMFNTPDAKQSVLDNLISQHAIKAEVKNANLMISDSVLHKNISAIPGFTLPDGKFDTESYKNALAARGMTPAMYEASLRQDLAQQQLINAVEGSAFIPKTVVTQVEAITAQEREVQAIGFKPNDFTAQVKPTDAMLKAYYDANAAQFSLPETASINYVVLSGDAIAAQMVASDEEIKSVYEQNLKNYTSDEQRRASHILIKVNKDASPADKAAAKVKAEEVLALVRKEPGNFAQLAKQYSQDEGSAAQGGDLDFFGKGMMLKPFEEAVYSLKQDEISGLVQSDFGFHIIHLTAIKAATVKPLEQVKEQIATDIKKQKASKKFAELAETFTNTVYEQSDSLKPAAEKLKLTIESADHLTRTPSPLATTNPLLANPKFLKALFSDDAIKNKRNTEAVEVGTNTLISAHIVEYKAASKRPLEEVKDVVTARVVAAEAEKLAKKAGETKLAALIANPVDATEFSEAKVVSRLQPPSLPKPAFEAVMKADTRKLPAFVGVEVPGQGYTVFRINKVQQAAADPGRTAEINKQVQAVAGSEDLFTYIELLKQKGKVKVIKYFEASAPAAPTAPVKAAS